MKLSFNFFHLTEGNKCLACRYPTQKHMRLHINEIIEVFVLDFFLYITSILNFFVFAFLVFIINFH